MIAPRTLPNQVTTARVDDHPVPVHQAHRRWATTSDPGGDGTPGGDRHEPVLVTVTIPVALSLDDAAAVLANWNQPVEDLDDDTVRELLAEAVAHGGCFEVEELRCHALNLDPGSEDAAYLASCRQRVAAVFGPPVPAQSGRVLVGVR